MLFQQCFCIKVSSVWALLQIFRTRAPNLKNLPFIIRVKCNVVWMYSYEKCHGWKTNDQLISDVLLRIPINRRARVGRLEKIYTHQLNVDTRYSLEDLPGAMVDRNRWRESHGVPWLDDIYIYIYMGNKREKDIHLV